MDGIQVVNWRITRTNLPATTGYCSAGLHPWDVDEGFASIIERIRTLPGEIKMAAVGESGLDSVKGPGMPLQRKAFEAQANIADDLGKPLIIHCVGSFHHILEIHKAFSPASPWIIHNFTGGPRLAEQLIRRGIFLSFGASLMKGHQKPAETLVHLPLEFMFLETDDDPDLDIAAVYRKASELRNIDLDSVKLGVCVNFQRLFGINID